MHNVSVESDQGDAQSSYRLAGCDLLHPGIHRPPHIIEAVGRSTHILNAGRDALSSIHRGQEVRLDVRGTPPDHQGVVEIRVRRVDAQGLGAHRLGINTGEEGFEALDPLPFRR